MPEYPQLEGWTIVGNPSGRRSFVKGKLRHEFESELSDNGYDRYLFVKNSQFVEDSVFDSIPKGTKTAEEILKGQRDW